MAYTNKEIGERIADWYWQDYHPFSFLEYIGLAESQYERFAYTGDAYGEDDKIND